jgi:TATA-binding protein-associated factor Taf7
LDEKLFLATLVDLPTLIEAQKTLDFRTFFKSCDVSQMLYIHNRVLDSFNTRTVEEVVKFAEGFRPFEKDDPEFVQ